MCLLPTSCLTWVRIASQMLIFIERPQQQNRLSLVWYLSLPDIPSPAGWLRDHAWHGVHWPSDVLVGGVLGTVVGRVRG